MEILKKTKSKSNLNLSLIYKNCIGYVFLLPSFIGVCVFVLIPFADTLKRSFFSDGTSKFQGLSIYDSVISNKAFRLAVSNTSKFIVTCIPILIVASIILAIIIKALQGQGEIFKTTFLLPMAIPVASIVLLWRALFFEKGLINGILVSTGKQPVDFMNTDVAFWVLILTYVWKNCGYDVILWLSGMDGISVSLYEAAYVDGAGAWKSFWYITLPSLLPTMFLTVVLSLINTFKVFREAYLVAGSYPHKSIYLLQHLFNNWFLDLDIERMSAAAVMVAGVLLILILLMQKFWNESD